MSDADAPIRLDVAFTPAALGAHGPDAWTTYIAVDVIRATTTLCVLFEGGCRRVLLAPDIAAARTARDALGPEWLLAGEVGGARPPGFDFGNSPAEFSTAELDGRQLIFATTNGTVALRACLGGRTVLAGSLRNVSAVAAAALASLSVATDQPADSPAVVVVCAGRDRLPAPDDTICAGYLIRCLREVVRASGHTAALGEHVQEALTLMEQAEQGSGLRAALAGSAAAQDIRRIGLEGDLDWCVAVDATIVVPRVTGSLAGHDLLIVEATK
jgi:2-phosphosulfolactate phosphatase